MVANSTQDLYIVRVSFVTMPKGVEGRFSEEYTKRIIRDVLNAIAYLHETKNIAHRDLKLANIMFTDNGPDAEIKLIDFGLSKVCFPFLSHHSL